VGEEITWIIRLMERLREMLGKRVGRDRLISGSGRAWGVIWSFWLD